MKKLLPLIIAIYLLGVVTACGLVDAFAHTTTVDLSWDDQAWSYYGHDHADNVILTFFNDRAETRDGGDSVWGLNGSDVIHLGAGSDYGDGEGGNDDINGNGGFDQLYGGSGNDVLKGGDGNDHLDCGAGSGDSAYGGLGDDTFANCDGNAVE